MMPAYVQTIQNKGKKIPEYIKLTIFRKPCKTHHKILVKKTKKQKKKKSSVEELPWLISFTECQEESVVWPKVLIQCKYKILDYLYHAFHIKIIMIIKRLK